ncbi:site-specific integrase [Pokkaliibacter sp. MBI-7]|uniref:tyrosine-type recombinase/integrase n=1 Tax=Pokkaliibacter sp. MBI-7 TaxID=3040600 RepID=UPI0024471F7F|nr:site-specific integrase [Pokkaliibacter sp. MBI-7]MDH2431093.1 site-specific integrase [Pokkaliibacter sp. MBI-7]
MEQQTQGSTKPITWEELLELYCLGKRVKRVTRSNYLNAINCFKRYHPNVLPQQVTHNMLLHWRVSVLDTDPAPLKPASWNCYSYALRYIFEYGKEVDVLTFEKNPFRRLKVRVPEEQIKVLSANDIIAYRTYLDAQEMQERLGKYGAFYPAWFYRCLFETFYHTGMRQHQLIHLTADDIDLKRELIHFRSEISKNSRAYTIPIAQDLLPYLRLMLHQSQYAGIQRHEQLYNLNRYRKRYTAPDKRMEKGQVHSFFYRLSKLVLHKATSHAFRHTIGTNLMQQPERNLFLTKELLGHKNLRSTLKYLTPDLEQMRVLLNNRKINY